MHDSFLKIFINHADNKILTWVIDNLIEVAGVFISLTYLYFSVKQKILLWPFGLLSAVFYIYIYYSNRLYADMGLQFYYVIISIYGWLLWSRGTVNDQEGPKTRKINKHLYVWLIPAFVLLVLIIFLILSRLTDSDVPFWDAFTTAGGIIGTWMLARKYIENWIIWIVVDSVSVILYLYKGLFATVVLFAVYTIIAYVGYRAWLTKLKDKVA